MKSFNSLLFILLVTQPLIAAEAPKDPSRRSRLTTDKTEDAADHRELTLYPGEERIIDLDFDLKNENKDKVVVGNPKILGTLLIANKRQLILRPVDKGESRVIVRDDEYNTKVIFDVRIVDSDLNRLVSDLKELLKDVEGVNISIRLGKAVIDGEVVVPADYGRIAAVIADPAVKGKVINMVTLSPLALQFLAKRIQEEINKAFAPLVTARVVNGQIWLEGSVYTEPDAIRAFKTALLYLPEAKLPINLLDKDATLAKVDPKDHPLIRSFLVVTPSPEMVAAMAQASAAQVTPPPPEKMIRVTAHIIEISKDFLKDFGFQWIPSFTANPSITMGSVANQSDPSATGTSFTATLSSLIPKLWSLQNAGFAKVLKTATIMGKNDSDMHVENTVKVLIPSSGGAVAAPPSQATVTFSVNLHPTIQGDMIELGKVDVKLGSIIGIQNGQPVTSEDLVSSTGVKLISGDSAAIGGIENYTLATVFNRDGGGSFNQAGGAGAAAQGSGAQTQPLFNLQRSKQQTKSKTQFVVFLTPELIDNAGDASDAQRRNFRIKVK